MDNIMDKLAGKISAQEIINANAAAEAAHREQIENQNRQYEEEINVLRQNAHKLEDRLNNIEIALKDLKKDRDEADVNVQELDNAIRELKNNLSDRLNKSDEATHDVGVRIYRNVQAAVIDEQKKQLDEIKEDLKKQMESIRGEFTMLVRQLDSMQRANRAKNRGIMPLTVIILIATIANLALVVLRIIGLV
ncbi:hypothetical protein [Butyrivibrio sp. WCE2006]|uniref:hypothetical protein n=1 Tax=Butyrivibrio sp. WCE2006 TaxID=1410611 RepID=UPI0005D27C33|nr:hypothetical protein [Butyrivibrio sp. WCE2006]